MIKPLNFSAGASEPMMSAVMPAPAAKPPASKPASSATKPAPSLVAGPSITPSQDLSPGGGSFSIQPMPRAPTQGLAGTFGSPVQAEDAGGLNPLMSAMGGGGPSAPNIPNVSGTQLSSSARQNVMNYDNGVTTKPIGGIPADGLASSPGGPVTDAAPSPAPTTGGRINTGGATVQSGIGPKPDTLPGSQDRGNTIMSNDPGPAPRTSRQPSQPAGPRYSGPASSGNSGGSVYRASTTPAGPSAGNYQQPELNLPQRPDLPSGPDLPEFQGVERPDLPEFQGVARPELPSGPNLPDSDAGQTNQFQDQYRSLLEQMSQGGVRDINAPQVERAGLDGFQSFIDEAYKARTRQLDPQFEQARKDFEQRMINRGLAPDSEAYREQFDNFMRARNDAYNSAGFGAMQFGLGAQAQDFGQRAQNAQFDLTGQQANQQADLQQLLQAMGQSGQLDQALIQDATRRYNTDVGAAMQQYSTDVGAQTQMYGNDLQSATQRYNANLGAQVDMYGNDLRAQMQRYNTDVGAAMNQYNTDVGAQLDMYGNDLRAQMQRYGADSSRMASMYGSDRAAQASNNSARIAANSRSRIAQMQNDLARQQLNERARQFDQNLGFERDQFGFAQNQGQFQNLLGLGRLDLGYRDSNRADARTNQALDDAAYNRIASVLASAPGSTQQPLDVMGAFGQMSNANAANYNAEMGQYNSLMGTLGNAATLFLSDRNAKTDHGTVEPEKALEAVKAMPVHRWTYHGDTRPHVGAMAQDFNRALHGEERTQISVIDAIGALTGAVQALAKRIEKMEGAA